MEFFFSLLDLLPNLDTINALNSLENLLFSIRFYQVPIRSRQTEPSISPILFDSVRIPMLSDFLSNKVSSSSRKISRENQSVKRCRLEAQTYNLHFPPNYRKRFDRLSLCIGFNSKLPLIKDKHTRCKKRLEISGKIPDFFRDTFHLFSIILPRALSVHIPGAKTTERIIVAIKREEMITIWD